MFMRWFITKWENKIMCDVGEKETCFFNLEMLHRSTVYKYTLSDFVNSFVHYENFHYSTVSCFWSLSFYCTCITPPDLHRCAGYLIILMLKKTKEIKIQTVVSVKCQPSLFCSCTAFNELSACLLSTIQAQKWLQSHVFVKSNQVCLQWPNFHMID